MDRSPTHRGLVAAAVALVVLFSCVSAAVATSGTVTYGCSPVNHNDTSAWLSVSRGLFRGSVYQYWLSQSYAYLTHVQQDIVGTSTWPLPPTVTPINGLVLSVNWTPHGFYDSVRVLLQDAQNCVYDYDIPTLKPWAYTLLHRHCYNASLPLWTKIVPDNINNMDQVKYIYLVSLDYVAALSFNTTLPTTIVKIPRGDVAMTSVVGASYQSNHGNDDQIYVIRSNDSPSKPSEILNFVVNTAKQGPDLRFGHITYLEGESDTLFTNDNSTQLLWTQVVPNWQNTGATQGVLFDYSLQAPRFFRRGELDFSGSPNAKWGTHAFSRVPGVEAMMITTANQTNAAGFDIHVVYLNADLPSLSFVDSLTVTDSTLPSLGQAIEFRDQWADFAVMMATHSVDGYTCLQLFIHCIADLTLCYGTMPRPLAGFQEDHAATA